MIRRAVAGVLALFTLFNGVSMLVDPGGWFERIPGVVETGPFKPALRARVPAKPPEVLPISRGCRP